MAKLKEPIGPLDKKVYLRRRIVLLLLVVGIPVAVLLFVFRPGSSGGVDQRQEISLPSDFTGASDEAVAPEEELPGCKKSDIDVTVAASKQSYGPGETPEIWMTISNTSSEPCVVDLGTKEMVFEITSGDELYWSSTHCQVDADSREVILEPKNPLSTAPLVWERSRSSPETCEGERPAAPGGGAAYNVRASANSVASSNAWQFLLY
jgi:hypothetical protein